MSICASLQEIDGLRSYGADPQLWKFLERHACLWRCLNEQKNVPELPADLSQIGCVLTAESFSSKLSPQEFREQISGIVAEAGVLDVIETENIKTYPLMQRCQQLFADGDSTRKRPLHLSPGSLRAGVA